MDKRKFYRLFAQIAGVILAFCVIGACFVYGKQEYSNKLFYTFLIVGVVALIILAIFICLQLFNDKQFKQKNKKHLEMARATFEAFSDLDKESSLNILLQTDYKQELKVIRENYKHDSNPQKNRIAKPNFNGTKPFRDFSVLKNGKIYYGCLVETNTKIYKPSKFVHQIYPAVVIYSEDEYYEKNPQDLVPVASFLYENRHNNLLKNESSFFSNILLDENIIDQSLTKGRKIYISTILLYRYHLPMGRLMVDGHIILPIIASPKTSTSIFVLDSEYWTNKILVNNMISHRLIKKFFKEKKERDLENKDLYDENDYETDD